MFIKIKKKFLSGMLAVLSVVPSVSTFTSPALAADVVSDHKNSEKSSNSDVNWYGTLGVVGAASLGVVGYCLYHALNLPDQVISDLGNTDHMSGTINSNYHGIPNLGNTCYINATIQMLYRIPGFRMAVENDISGDERAEAVKTIFKIIQKGEGAVKLGELVRAVDALVLGIKGRQEDPSEFILEKIDPLTEKYGMGSLISLPVNIPVIGRKSFSMRELLEHGGNVDIGKITEKVIEKYPNRVLSCEDINRLAVEFNAEESWKMNSKLNITQRDGQMLVYLNRTNFSNTTGIKNDTSVDFDVFYSGFALKGVVVHCGKCSLNSGHYVFFLREKDGWYLFNDNSVDKVSHQQVKDGLIYSKGRVEGASTGGVLYLYERV